VRRIAVTIAAVLAVAGPTAAHGALTHPQRLRVDKLISQFENSTSKIQYCYVVALDDGRGYTVGRAGFTSATGDLLEVAERYTKLVPGNALADLLPRLRELARDHDGSIEGLERLPGAWHEACRDPRQRAVQDAIVDKEYYLPAVRHAKHLKLHTPLSLGAIYDASIQHGDGPDPDGVPAMLKRAAKRAGGTPRSGVTEKRFLLAFLKVRRATLAHARDPSTRAAWAESVPRAGAWLYLYRTHQFELRSPIKLRTPDYHLTIR
jgi:chitosanase